MCALQVQDPPSSNIATSQPESLCRLLARLDELNEKSRRDHWLGVLARLRRRLEDHFAKEEIEKSLLKTLMLYRPQDAYRARCFERQHPCLLEDLRSLIKGVASGGGLDVLRLRARVFTRQLRDHELAESELLYEAFCRDDGNSA